MFEHACELRYDIRKCKAQVYIQLVKVSSAARPTAREPYKQKQGVALTGRNMARRAVLPWSYN